MKVVTVVGARPQFIKAALVSRLLRQAGHQEFLVHTGQHYDHNLSQVFFDDLDIPEPDVNLEVGSGLHGQQTGQMLMGLEEVMEAQRPDWVLVYGDTNSTLAGALAGAKLQIPVAHVEAGERAFDKTLLRVHPATIPEELNRIVADHASTLLLCATQRAVDNLKREGISQGVFWVGDVTFDVFLRMRSIAQERSTIIQSLRLSPGEYLLATIHHVRNTNDRDRMEAILAAMAGMQTHVVFPIHPRTRKIIREYDLEPRLNEASNISVIEPVGYLDMLELERNARVILTDSGGVTREAYFAQVPCVVVDDTIEWLDLVDAGWCHLVDAQTELIVRAVDRSIKPSLGNALLGDGDASRYILERLTNWRAGR